MQKKIIALAVAGLMSGAAFAQSNVTIYGVMHGAYDSIDNDVSGQDRYNRITSHFSRIGFKGTEALGNGLSANWQIEQGINLDNDANSGAAATSGWNTRNTYVGLSSKTLGEVRLGHHDTAYKMSTGSLDVFADTLADYNSIIGSWNGARQTFDKRAQSTVLYLSPMWNGLQVTANYGFDNENGNDTPTTVRATTGVDNPYNWGAAATYANGPLFAALAYEKHRVASSVGHYEVRGWKAGVGYTFMGTTKVGLLYENLDGSNSNNAAAGTSAAMDLASRNAWGMNVAHTMGNMVLKAQYLRAGDSDVNNANDSARVWALGLDYNMSKRTQVYALYTKTSNDRDAYYGMGHGTHAYAPVAANEGKDPSGFSFGLKHSF